MRGRRLRAWYPAFRTCAEYSWKSKNQYIPVHYRVTFTSCYAAQLDQMAACEGAGDREFSRALDYAVQRVQTATFSPKPEQTAAIRAIYKGKDVFVWLPTGFGKSFCYEAIPFVLDWKLKRTNGGSLVLIVSPLVALMVDQVCSLRARSVKAAIISGGAGGFDEELIARESDLEECSLLFGAPEAFLKSKWREAMEKPCITQRIVAVVIDEAHCVTMW